MKIIDDTEVFEPSECYFAISSYDGQTTVAITGIEFYDEIKCLDDGFGDHSLPEYVNEKLENSGIFPEMEAMWGADLSENEAREVMLKLGFVESKEMTELLNGGE